MELGKGGCRGITTLTTLALRNIGIVSAIDECPVWAHRNSGHQWNVVRTESGEWIPFNGAEDSIGAVFPTLNDSVKAPKIYRKQFTACKQGTDTRPFPERLSHGCDERLSTDGGCYGYTHHRT